MIISRTPYRISFFGGGTDYPDWYIKNGGATLSVTIDKYSYITGRFLPPFFDYKYRIRYYKREEINDVNTIQHPSIRECIKQSKITDGLDIVHHGDLPPKSGIGSSSSFTVGMIKLLSSLKSEYISPKNLSLNAINIEQNILKENVGSQDQVAAAYGGFNKIVFNKDGQIDVEGIYLSPERKARLENSMCLFFSGISRSADSIAKVQIENIKMGLDMSKSILFVNEAFDIIYNSKNLEIDFGLLLNNQWAEKKQYSKNISTESVDQIYDHAMKNGAIGGKLLGAGGGGFILFITKDKHRLISALNHLTYVPFKFEFEGSKIIYFTDNENK